MRFLIDAQLPFALIPLITGHGHEAEHVGALGLGAAKDEDIWRRAARDSFVLITKDADFARRKTLVGGGPSIVWIRIPNTRRAALLAWFPTVWPHIVTALGRGEPIVEIVRASPEDTF